MAGRGVVIRGVRQAVRMVKKEYAGKRRKIHRTCMKVGEDLLRQARNNAPIREGTLVDSMSNRVIDRGKGNGFTIEVTGGDTPYALRMHESFYQAHNPHDPSDRDTVRAGRAGFWVDANGNRHGRKFLTRAIDENKRKYIRALEAVGDR